MTSGWRPSWWSRTALRCPVRRAIVVIWMAVGRPSTLCWPRSVPERGRCRLSECRPMFTQIGPLPDQIAGSWGQIWAEIGSTLVGALFPVRHSLAPLDALDAPDGGFAGGVRQGARHGHLRWVTHLGPIGWPASAAWPGISLNATRFVGLRDRNGASWFPHRVSRLTAFLFDALDRLTDLQGACWRGTAADAP